MKRVDSRACQWRNTGLTGTAAVAIAVALAINPFPTGAAADEVVIREKALTWQQARLTHGEDLFNELCAVCHGVSGKGDGPAASELTKTVPDLTLLAANNGGEFPFERLEDFITGEERVYAHGTIDMPVWGRAFQEVRQDWSDVKAIHFAKHKIYDIVEYIETLQAD